MKRILTIFMVLSLCLSMTACNESGIKQNQKLLDSILYQNLEGCREAIEDGASLDSLYGTSGAMVGNNFKERNPLRIACAPRYDTLRSRRIVKLLLEKGADPNAVNNNGRSVFSDAVSSSSIALCQMMIEHGGDFQKKDKYGLLPFDNFCIYAVDNWTLPSKLDFLLSNGAQLSSKSLSYTIKGEHGEGYTRYGLVKRMAEKAEEKSIVMELTDLQTFILRGDLDSFKKTLQTNKIKNALFYAAAYGSAECMEYMFHHGGSMSEVDHDGNTLLAVASKSGDMDTLQWLAKNYQWTNDQWYQALKGATECDQLECTRYLMQKKIDISPSENEVNDALCYAILNRNQVIVDEMLKYGFPLEKAGNAMYCALENDLVDMAAFLLSKGFDMTQHYNEMSALDQACSFGSTNCIDLLLKRGADVNEPGHFSCPLFCACSSGSYEAVSTLLKCGAKVNVEGDTEAQPITAAIYSGSLDIIKLLVENDARITDEILETAKYCDSYRIYEFLQKQSRG